jgi:hypothetical protein
VVTRLWHFDEKALTGQDWVLMSEKDQGYAAFYSRDLSRIHQYILDRPQIFRMAESFAIPGGHTIRLYRLKP